FAAQLPAAAAGIISTIQPASITYEALDLNGNKIADPNELLLGLGNVGFGGFDPQNPTSLSTVNQIGQYSTPLTQEILVGGDHELFANFSVSAALTYRYMNHFDWSPLIGVSSSDYVRTGTLVGSADPIGSFSVPVYALPVSKVPPGNGVIYEE